MAECVSVSVYMRVCIRCPFNQLSESQQSAAYAGGLGRICAQRPTTVIIREKILLFSASWPDGPFSDVGSQMREIMFWFSANELPPMLQPV